MLSAGLVRWVHLREDGFGGEVIVQCHHRDAEDPVQERDVWQLGANLVQAPQARLASRSLFRERAAARRLVRRLAIVVPSGCSVARTGQPMKFFRSVKALAELQDSTIPYMYL